MRRKDTRQTRPTEIFPSMSFHSLVLKIQDRVVVAALSSMKLITLAISSFQLINALLLLLCDTLLWLEDAGLGVGFFVCLWFLIVWCFSWFCFGFFLNSV